MAEHDSVEISVPEEHGVQVDSTAGLLNPEEVEILEEKFFSYQNTMASQSTVRKEYADLREMLQKAIGVEGDTQENQKKLKPFESIWFGSYLGFNWITPVIKSAYKGDMDPDNLGLSKSEKSDTTYVNFKKNWEQELQSDNPSLDRALLNTFWKIFLKATILKGVWGLILVFTMGILIQQLVLYVQNKSRGVWQGYVVAVSFLISSLLLGFLLHHMTSWSVRLGIAIKSAVNRAIFDKAMTAKATSSNLGDILSLISRDTAVLSQAAKAIQYLWSGPLEVAGLTAFAGYFVGLPAVWIVILCAIAVPLQYILGLTIDHIREKNTLSNTERLLIIHEILYAIKLVKFYTWEDSFSKKIEAIRAEELKQLTKAAYIKAFNLALIFFFPPLAAVGTFFWMSQEGQELVPGITFAILTLCNSLRFPLVMLPSGIKVVNDARKGLKRIEKFLLSKDRTIVPRAPETGIIFENVSLGYKDNEDNPDLVEVKLKNVNFEIRPGQSMAVVGLCGTGKSTLLRGILGEAEVALGSLKVAGRIAYVPQNPFIMHGTVRDNILFGLELDQEWYLEVLRACCLPSDLKSFNNGDLTFLSEGGINLSGGQRQRIALARAIYSRADIFLMDSVLSALDPATGRKCFRRCVQKLCKDAIVVLITHDLASLPNCDLSMIIGDGEVIYTGPYNEDELCKIFSPSMVQASKGAAVVSISNVKVDEKQLAAFAAARVDVDLDELSDNKDESLQIQASSASFSSEPKASQGAEAWIQECGVYVSIFTLILFVSAQVVRIFSDFWIRFWVNDQYGQSNGWYLGIYGAIVGLFGIMLVVRGIIFYLLSFKAARSLYSKLYEAIINAPILFFTTEPLGKILKSFSHDQDAVDDSLPDSAHVTLIIFSIVVTTTVLVCIVIPWMIIPTAGVLVLWWIIQKFSKNASNTLKTAHAETNSAAIVHASESMHGIAVIRAFGQEDFVRRENQIMIDSNISAVFYLEHVELWAELRIDCISAVYVFLTALLIVIERDSISPGNAGLAISNATQLLVFMAIMVQGFGDVLFQMYSVSRIDEYIKKTPSEDFSSSLEMPKEGGKPCFPAGQIDVKNIFVAYDPMKEMVLKNVSVSVQAHERIGIVGRTGSGKTSLLNSIFRLMEVLKGSIEIDGLDVRQLPLKELREGLCIIPQEPVLFKGNFRTNLDPFNEYTEEELWDALEKSHMKDYVSSFPKKLETEIVEGGQNISIGQKQLLCLTRVILKKNCRILVLDEATSALDPHTDQLIQESIRNAFKTQTILTIAHRLDTIKDYDKILVLHYGELVEFDTVPNLLSKEQGYFKTLYESYENE
jgi:ABC-type multidrug transport system fused ATPase/permease subunit